jgi:hypothetical protein
MRLRVTIRRWIVVVAVVGIGLAVLRRWTPWRESPKSHWRSAFAGRICVDLFPIEPPQLSRFADPYDLEFPPAPPRVEQ